jgi:hypothetical protein
MTSLKSTFDHSGTSFFVEAFHVSLLALLQGRVDEHLEEGEFGLSVKFSCKFTILVVRNI